MSALSQLGITGLGNTGRGAPDDLGPYRLGREIGRGGHGTVFEALHVDTGASVAIKRISIANLDRESLDSIEGEVTLLSRLHHQNVCNLFTAIRAPKNLYIVLELVEGGSLSSAIKRFGCFGERLTAL